MIPLDRIRSADNVTTKHVFDAQGQVVEATYLNKGDGKDIVCVPCQTSCKLGCTFCFLTGSKAPARNLAATEIVSAVHDVLDPLTSRATTLLVSYMGSGEPLVNLPGVLKSAQQIQRAYKQHYSTVRFAVASIIPSLALMADFTELVLATQLPFKFHFSLHSPDDLRRRVLMPAAEESRVAIGGLTAYQTLTGNPAEIHYTLIAGENDRDEDLWALIALLKDRDLPIKFLAFRPRPDAALAISPRLLHFRTSLAAAGITSEFYDPPGADIGASCGQFLLDPARRTYLPQAKPLQTLPQAKPLQATHVLVDDGGLAHAWERIPKEEALPWKCVSAGRTPWPGRFWFHRDLIEGAVTCPACLAP